MVDEFQAFLLLVVTALFVYIVIRVVQMDLAAGRRQRRRAAPPQPEPRRQPRP